MSGDKSHEPTEEYDPFGLSEQHNSNAGGFSDLSKAYKADPTIEHYVRLRRENPGKLIEVQTGWQMDWLLSNSELLESYGIDPQDMAGCLDANLTDVSRVSLRLLECLIERRAMLAEGRTHLQSRGEAIGDSLVNYLISMMLDAMDWSDRLEIPRDLIVLIKHQLGADVSAEAKAQEVRELRQTAIWGAAELRIQGKLGSIRQVAGFMGVSPSTVARWFSDSSFDEEVEKIKSVLESDDFKRMQERSAEWRRKKEAGE